MSGKWYTTTSEHKMRPEVRAVVEQALEQGAVWRWTKGRHVWLRLPDGGTASVGGTPSDRRALPNFIGQLRRQGMKIK